MDSKDYIYQIFGCQGRKVIVTGASSGLGAAMARVLASAGADLTVIARRRERLEALVAKLAACENSVHSHPADLTDPAALVDIVDHARATLGGCDRLVANAGTAGRVRLEEMPEQNFNALVDLNLKVQWQLAKAFFPLLRDSTAGRVVNIASIYGLGASVFNGLEAYTISKHWLIGLTHSQAVEWAKHGIIVNAIAPGYFPAELTESALENDTINTRLRAFTPQDRFGQPEELGPALLFLASPASGYVNGTVIPVDGGWTAW